MTESAPAGIRRRRWVRIGVGALLVFLALAAFHRPIFFRGTKLLIVRFAREQKLDLQYDISGTIFTSLRIRDLRAVPLEPGPVDRLDIGEIDLRYSLPDLVRKGLAAFLKDLEMRHAQIVIDPGESVPRTKSPEEKAVKFPALFPERLVIEDLNLTILTPSPEARDTVIERFDLRLEPAAPGALSAGRVQLSNGREWRDIAATATFHDRHFVLENLVLDAEVHLERAHLDASELDRDRLAFGLNGRFFGGTVSIETIIADVNEANRLAVQASAASVDAERVMRHFGLALPVSARVATLNVDLTGKPDAPASWIGTLAASLDEVKVERKPFGEATIRLDCRDGEGTLTFAQQIDSEASLTIEAAGTLPPALDGFADTSARGRIEVNLPRLLPVSKHLPQPASGDARGTIDFTMTAGRTVAEARFQSEHLVLAGAEINQTRLSSRLELAAADGNAGSLTDRLTTASSLGISTATWRGYTAENIRLAAASRGRSMTLESLEVFRGVNVARFRGSAALPLERISWREIPWQGTLEIEAPDLSAFATDERMKSDLAGALSTRGEFAMSGGTRSGSMTLAGRAIRFRGLAARTLDAEVALSDTEAQLSRLHAVLDERNSVVAAGTWQLDSPHRYSIDLTAALEDLRTIEPALRAVGQRAEIEGSLDVNWRGHGEWDSVRHTGDGKLALEKGRFGNHRDLKARLEATMTPDFINAPVVQASADRFSADAALRWSAGMLSATNVIVRHDATVLARGSAEIPLIRANNRLTVPEDGPLQINLEGSNINLASPPIPDAVRNRLTGIVDAAIAVRGTLKDPNGTVRVHGTALRSAALPQIGAAEASITATLGGRRVRATGNVRLPRAAPLELVAEMPLDLADTIQKRSLDRRSPIEARLRLPRSALDPWRSVVSGVRAIRGAAAAEVLASGTIENPVFSGFADVELDYLRFSNASLPPVDKSRGRITFERNAATIARFDGRVAGGSFRASGSVTFPSMTDPVFDLRWLTREALVRQDDNLTVRVNTDLSLTGPMKSATLAGTVALTRSRFFRDVEILPIGLPGRPAPRPPVRAAPPGISTPPVSEWKLDIAIRTADPFLIEGNLATGRAVADLKLTGTGRQPVLEGSIRIDELIASLPFSRLEVTSGNIYFTAADPFVPRLEIRATSVIRDYRVSVHIFGTRDRPEAVFTSQPPLPESDIVALLATGTTRDELSKDPNLLAGRAAVLVFRKLYRKVFRRDEVIPDQLLGKGAQIDVGAIDPKSGRESIAVRMPLAENWVLTGGVDVGGDFRGQVKYVVRFR